MSALPAVADKSVVALSVGVGAICWVRADHTTRVVTNIGYHRLKLEQSACPVSISRKMCLLMNYVPSAPLYTKYRPVRLRTSQLNVSASVAKSTVILARLHATVDTILHNRVNCGDTQSSVSDSRLVAVNPVDVFRPLGLIAFGQQLTCSHLIRQIAIHDTPTADNCSYSGDRSLPQPLSDWRLTERAADTLCLSSAGEDIRELLARTCLLAIMSRVEQKAAGEEERPSFQEQRTAVSVS